MTPVGHASIGFLIGHRWGPWAVYVAVAGSVVPDIDFVLFFSEDFNAVHRTWSHSALFTLVIGTVAAAAVNRYRQIPFLRILIPFICGAGSHLAIDSVLDNNPSNGLGVALWYPFSVDRFRLFSIDVLTPVHDCDWTTPGCMFDAAIPLIFYELLLLCGVFWMHRRGRTAL